MKNVYVLGLFTACLFASFSSVWAKDYQVTGPVLEVSDSKIVVQKGKDRWELDRNASTKVDGELKEGSKVTIHYTMTATDIEVKASKAKKGK